MLPMPEAFALRAFLSVGSVGIIFERVVWWKPPIAHAWTAWSDRHPFLC